MSEFELLGLVLLVLGWVVALVIRRVFRQPRPLGTIADEAPPGDDQPPQPPDAPLDIEWGRAPPVPSPAQARPPADGEPFAWSVDAAQAELEVARQWTHRQARRPRALEPVPRSVHPHRPRLHTVADLRRAVVAATVLGPCRALERWEPPDAPG